MKNLTSKRIEKLNLNKSGHAYRMMNELLTNKKTNTVIHYAGRGWKSSSIKDYTSEIAMYLVRFGIKYEIGSDSPRGGRLGKFIKIVK